MQLLWKYRAKIHLSKCLKIDQLDDVVKTVDKIVDSVNVAVNLLSNPLFGAVHSKVRNRPGIL